MSTASRSIVFVVMERLATVSPPVRQEHFRKKKQVDGKEQEGKLRAELRTRDEGNFGLNTEEFKLHLLQSALPSWVWFLYCIGGEQSDINQIFFK